MRQCTGIFVDRLAFFSTIDIEICLLMPEPKTSRCQHSSATKNLFIGAVLSGQDIAQAAWKFGLKDSTAHSIMKKYNTTGTAKNRPRSGRLMKLTDTAKHHIVCTARKNCRAPFSEIRNLVGLKADEITIRHVLNHAGYHRRVARKVPFLTKLHRHACMAWARLYHKYSLQQWARVIWSDEAYIYLGDDRGRFLSHGVQMKNTLTNVWFRPSSNHWCVLWYGHVS
jgi:transposase